MVMVSCSYDGLEGVAMGNEEARSSDRRARERGTPVMVRLPADMMASLTSHAQRRGLPPSTFARQLIKEGLDRLERQAPQ